MARRRVISSSSLLRRHRLFLLASLSRSRSVVVSSASCPVALSSCSLVVLIIAPCLMCFVPAPCVRSRLHCVLVLFLIASLPVLAISRAGRSLLARFLFVAALALSSRVPCVCLLAPVDRFRSFSSPRSHLVPPLVPPLVLFMSYRPLCSFVCSPRLSTSVGGEHGGSFSLCLPLFSSCGRRAVSAG